ncbi:MAG: MCE family protein [Verrucomicrobia bacterium]|nr:MCE family protein [Verrucomicrobiota bacterium]
MALQDLTPQLRTRLSRMERAVGWFVALAVVLLVIGFAYYIQNTAKRRGWFTPKYVYSTSLNSAAGLKVGDPVKLMGDDVGQITRIELNNPSDWYGLTVYFNIRSPKQGYIWSDSQVKVGSDFLGSRFLEVTKGFGGVPTADENTNKVVLGILLRTELEKLQKSIEQRILADTNSVAAAEAQMDPDELQRQILAESNTLVREDKRKFYGGLQEIYWLTPLESPALNERLDELVKQIEKALPNILALTNQIAATLSNSVTLTSNLNVLATTTQPAAANLATISAQLRGQGAFGEWALGTDGRQKLMTAFDTANNTLAHTDTNLTALAENLAVSLDNLAGITSNLHAQVAANTNMLGEISDAVIHADEVVQGLKKHWLLKSAFREKKPVAKPGKP